MNRVLLATLAACVVSAAATVPSTTPVSRVELRATDSIPTADRIRLAEAFRIAEAIGDSVWHGWSQAPFGVLLVTPEREFLIRHPNRAPGFTAIGYDSVLASEVFTRPRTFSTGLLATFPAIDTVPVIVIGEAEQTGKRSASWVLTVLHEHFHQWQMSSPRYDERVNALRLSHRDSTGMWMLNYAFPYRSTVVQSRFKPFAHSIVTARAVPARAVTEHADDLRLRSVVQATQRLRAVISDADYRYMAFQMWQEGVARYTELQCARLAAGRVTESEALRSLPGFTTFAQEADSLAAEIDAAPAYSLANVQRVAFYPTGAAYALLLDRTRPGWKDAYLRGRLALELQARLPRQSVRPR
jgi:hypothetical protein